MKLGYKKTEIGLIPVDWEITTIGDLCHIFGRIGFRGYTVKDIVDEGNGAIAISPSNIQDGKTLFKDCTYISWHKYEESPEIKIFDGDVILVKTASIGKTAMVKNIPGKATLNPQIVVFKKIKSNAVFFSYILGFKTIQEQIKMTVVGGVLPTLSQKLIAKFKLPLPSTQSEQLAIAKSLSDVDALLATLDKTITKKRDLKHAAMQQILTGKTRLTGYSSAWKVMTFSDVLYRLNTKAHQIKTIEFQKIGKYPVVDQGKNLIVGYSDRDDKRLVCPDGGVIIFGDHTCIVKFIDFDFIVGADGTQIIQGKNQQNTQFYSYQLQYNGVDTTGYNRHFKILKERHFLVPPLSEQIAIANILSDMDKELSKLEVRRNKTKQLKQAMMQELLTGKSRLIKKGVH